MFTGIIQNLGKVIDFSNGELEISTSLDLSDCNIGSSICCNGVCLTATKINFQGSFELFGDLNTIQSKHRHTKLYSYSL